VLQSLTETMFRLTRIIMVMAPVAAGAALAYTVGSMGMATLLPLGKLLVTCYARWDLHCCARLILLFARIPVGRFAAAVAEPAALGFATTSSEAALPLAMERMEEFGVPRWIVSFVIPTGYSFNMTGSSIYLSMAALFAAQAAGLHLTVGQQIVLLATLMLTSKGIAGVPRAVLVILMAVASSFQIPAAAVLMLLGVDTLMDMGRTAMNVIGNCMAAAVNRKWVRRHGKANYALLDPIPSPVEHADFAALEWEPLLALGRRLCRIARRPPRDPRSQTLHRRGVDRPSASAHRRTPPGPRRAGFHSPRRPLRPHAARRQGADSRRSP
jgi:Na+/H+-dicarboxylate symporter